MSELRTTNTQFAPYHLLENIQYMEIASGGDGMPYYFTKPYEISMPAFDAALYKTGGIMDNEREFLASTVPATPTVDRANTIAQAFVDAYVGPTSHGETRLYDESKRTENDKNHIGHCTYALGNIATSACQDIPGVYRDRFLTSHLVHEHAHSTAIPTRKVTIMHRPSRDAKSDVADMRIGYTFGMEKFKYSLNKHTGEVAAELKNQFFEEAFAEETAARYRAGGYESPDELVPLMIDSVCRPIPQRYLSIAESDPGKQFDLSSTAYTAYLVSRLSECAGVDIYGLMAYSRYPEHEVKAKRAIARVIDSIQPGLYKKLRDLPYPNTSEEYLRHYDEILSLTEPRKGEAAAHRSTGRC